MPRVAYVHSDELIRAADCLPANEGRASLVHSLIESYALLCASSPAGERAATLVPPLRASREQLTRFHDQGYIGTLSRLLRCSRGSLIARVESTSPFSFLFFSLIPRARIVHRGRSRSITGTGRIGP